MLEVEQFVNAYGDILDVAQLGADNGIEITDWCKGTFVIHGEFQAGMFEMTEYIELNSSVSPVQKVFRGDYVVKKGEAICYAYPHNAFLKLVHTGRLRPLNPQEGNNE